MYQRFRARDFRCFEDLKLDHLGRLNLIAGMNNVGKTTLLEAIFLHCGVSNPTLTLRIEASRGVEKVKVQFGPPLETPWDSLFRGFDSSKVVVLEGQRGDESPDVLRLRAVHAADELARIRRSVQHDLRLSEPGPDALGPAQILALESREAGQDRTYYLIVDEQGVRTEPIPPPPPFPGIIVPAGWRAKSAEDVERLGKLELIGREDLLLHALQVIEPRLKRLTVVVRGGEPVIHGDLGLPRLVPLPLMGGGMVRLATMVLAIGNAPEGVVLVDEIENGLHHSIMRSVWQALAQAAREVDVQVFATTHSLDCVSAAHSAFRENGPDDFRLHRLERTKGGIRALTYDSETLGAAFEADLEVR